METLYWESVGGGIWMDLGVFGSQCFLTLMYIHINFVEMRIC